MIKKTDRLRQNGIVQAIEAVLDDQTLTILDMGCGHGQLAERLTKDHPGWQFTGVDVVVQPDCRIEVAQYDGVSIPFDDNAFDAVFCVDMLHHTHDPQAVLKEATRVAKKWVIVKDHVSNSKWDHRALTLLDWIGNAGTGVPLPYNFLSSEQWQVIFENLGLVEVDKRQSIRYWPGILGSVLDRHYHFVSKLASSA